MASSKEQLAALFKQLVCEENKALATELAEARKTNAEFKQRIAEEIAKGAALDITLEKIRVEMAAITVETTANEHEQSNSNKKIRASQGFAIGMKQLTATYRESI